ncbi:hypothetical protein B0T24DRAFT_537431 [Lasiosphaeria ovina]|uniref:3-beta hydroxysteroid dehydrogenase/isomerase domain-containing protein n=1 Tax=Lasiosphaeria ovina TaxID=92902 RepID=A0AAE0JVK1_9PEZI|nr:hypothetical protein B0T24DRAFT_537431 [Lasiosphaeria ovina]
MSVAVADHHAFLLAAIAIGLILAAHLARLNWVLGGTPSAIRKIADNSWSRTLLLATYKRIQANPITTKTYAGRIPPKLNRRYIVTGGSGLVGDYIVQQLLQRGQRPDSIRIVDYRAPRRGKQPHAGDLAAKVGFVQADISSADSTDLAFSKPWDPSVASLPLTVFHTAAVIVPSDRSKLTYAFCEAVNVKGTQHVLDAARRAGADVLVSTTSASINIRPVEFWRAPWKTWSRSESRWPAHYWQTLDERDFFAPLRAHDGYYSNYAVSKAAAERIVCGANSSGLRTGCIRPANGIYGCSSFSDNTVGGPLNIELLPEWSSHVVQSFVHGSNAAIAHLNLEAVLANPDSSTAPQAGRPFVVTDPNPPIPYGSLYRLIGTLADTPFRTMHVPPILMLLVCHVVEWYILLHARFPLARKILPPITGDVKHVQPALLSICTHLVASNAVAGQPVAAGGLGYSGVITTLEGMAQEMVWWNHAHASARAAGETKVYQSSVSLAEEIQRAAGAGANTRWRLDIAADGRS